MAVCGNQFSAGDQGPSKEAFWRTGCSQCQNISCSRTSVDQKTIVSEDFPAGCRMNGDGYGTTVYTCHVCGWKTSFQYDDASEPYYYETRHYRDTPIRPKPPHPWSGITLYSWFNHHQVADHVRQHLRKYALSIQDLASMNRRKLKALGLRKNDAEVIALAIEKTNKELETGEFFLKELQEESRHETTRSRSNSI